MNSSDLENFSFNYLKSCNFYEKNTKSINHNQTNSWKLSFGKKLSKIQVMKIRNKIRFI